MIFKYGSYAHAQNECSLVAAKLPRFNDGGQVVSHVHRFRIEGFLQAASQAALTTALNALKAAYEIQGQDAALLLDDGLTPTHHVLTNSATLGGVRVVEGPSFPEGRGAEYGGFRHYRLTLEAEVPVSGYAGLLIFFEESVSFQGGGPRFVYLQTLTGPPQKQTVADNSPFAAVQSGTSVGYAGYPIVPGPLWPNSEHRGQRHIHYGSPKRSGPAGSPQYSEYEVSWSYQFEDASAMSGVPNVWG